MGEGLITVLVCWYGGQKTDDGRGEGPGTYFEEISVTPRKGRGGKIAK